MKEFMLYIHPIHTFRPISHSHREHKCYCAYEENVHVEHSKSTDYICLGIIAIVVLIACLIAYLMDRIYERNN